MSDPEKTKSDGPPESPTTARELDFDDEPQDTPGSPPSRKSGPGVASIPAQGSGEDVPPPKPPRPVSQEQQAENTLKEAFPSIDAAVVKAVLRASGGKVEPAFNALLGMSDPDSQAEPTPPPQPPRHPQVPLAPTSTEQSQLLADEQYARQLAEHYSDSAAYAQNSKNGSRGGPRDPGPLRPKRDTGLKPNEVYDDRERSFIDDDLPVIRENIKKGFFETQTAVNSWVTKLRKKIDGDEEETFQDQPVHPLSSYNSAPPRQQFAGRRSGDLERRSADRERYDADPQVLGDDFASLQMRDHETPPRRSSRPLANPDLFKPTPPRPHSGNGRRVSFQDGPPEEIDVGYRASPDPATKRPISGSTSSGNNKSSKWQPLSAVDPSPVGDHDPFSLGDSDDEDAVGKKKDLRADDSERLKAAAAEAMADDMGVKKELEEKEKSGTRDREAEKLLGKP